MDENKLLCNWCSRPLYHKDEVARVLLGKITSYGDYNSLTADEEIWLHQRCYYYLIRKSELEHKIGEEG